MFPARRTRRADSEQLVGAPQAGAGVEVLPRGEAGGGATGLSGGGAGVVGIGAVGPVRPPRGDDAAEGGGPLERDGEVALEDAAQDGVGQVFISWGPGGSATPATAWFTSVKRTPAE